MNLRWTLLASISALMLTATALAYLQLIPGGWFRTPWDKAAHGLLYGGLAFSLALALPRRRQALAWMIPMGLAVLDESTQALSPFRSAELLDFAADGAGVLVAMTIFHCHPGQQLAK